MEIHSLNSSTEIIETQKTSFDYLTNIKLQEAINKSNINSKNDSIKNAIHRWLWHNTSNQRSVSDSYCLETETFYFIRQICFAISLITWTMS